MRLLLYSILIIFSLSSSQKSWSQEDLYSFDGSELANSVHKIFDRSCAECHDGTSRARSKGRFGTVMNFAAMREDPDLLIPGNAEDSEIYLVATDPDPEFVMPPPDSDCPPLSVIEANLVKFWINSGAPDPVFAKTTESKEIDTKTETNNEPDSGLGKAFGKLHPLVIHFPIATIWLAFLAAISETMGISKSTRSVVTWSLAMGAMIAVFSVTSGWINAEFSGFSDDTVRQHRWSGVAVAILSALCLVFHILRSQSEKQILAIAYWVTLVLAVVTVSFAGHTGGILVYGEETFFHLLG